jgi:hypothetical protein
MSMASDPSPSPTDPGAERAGGPVLGLLAKGLELWLRQQCEAIERLEIRLQGSAAQLVRGQLDGVVLEARRVMYRNLRIDRVELRSAPIRLRMGALLRGQSLQLEHPFAVQGTVAFNADDLGRSLATPEWQSLGDGLVEDLLGLTPLAGLRIEGDRLILAVSGSGSFRPVEVATAVAAAEGTVELRSVAGGAVARLPMDGAIQIARAELAAGLLELEGVARVSP